MRVAFLGTSAFASRRAGDCRAPRPSLVVTQPDRPAGRHAVLAPPPVKLAAEELGHHVVQPERVSQDEGVAALGAARPDVLVVAAYGQLLRAVVFGLAPLGAINIHASFCPAIAAPRRSAGPSRGETTTESPRSSSIGETPTDAPRSIADIKPDETAGARARLAALGTQAILDTLSGLDAGTLEPKPQRTVRRSRRSSSGRAGASTGRSQRGRSTTWFAG
jgi:methionyl-tRNA formyltransferase